MERYILPVTSLEKVTSTAPVELLCGAARAEDTKRKRPVATFILDEVMI